MSTRYVSSGGVNPFHVTPGDVSLMMCPRVMCSLVIHPIVKYSLEMCPMVMCLMVMVPIMMRLLLICPLIICPLEMDPIECVLW